MVLRRDYLLCATTVLMKEACPLALPEINGGLRIPYSGCKAHDRGDPKVVWRMLVFGAPAVVEWRTQRAIIDIKEHGILYLGCSIGLYQSYYSGALALLSWGRH